MLCAAFIVSLGNLTGCRTRARGNSPVLQPLWLRGVGAPSASTEEHLAQCVMAGSPAPELSTRQRLHRFAWWIIVLERIPNGRDVVSATPGSRRTLSASSG